MRGRELIPKYTYPTMFQHVGWRSEQEIGPVRSQCIAPCRGNLFIGKHPSFPVLYAGVEANVKDVRGKTALMLTVAEGDEEMIRLLLFGIETTDESVGYEVVDARYPIGNTALMFVVSQGRGAWSDCCCLEEWQTKVYAATKARQLYRSQKRSHTMRSCSCYVTGFRTDPALYSTSTGQKPGSDPRCSQR